MAKNLVIVESPAKAKTIEGFLGKDFVVASSFGHIRDLPKGNAAVDIEKNFQPKYEIPKDKAEKVSALRKLAKSADEVWLATDEDREGEAISWHLAEVLNLDVAKTKRIVFHEITKSAIQHAVANPRHINLDLVNAQQARRILDRLVGFELSPVLWRKVKPSLSAGRVQSVAVRLIVEREREIMAFKGSSSFKVKALFTVNDKGKKRTFSAETAQGFKNESDALAFVQQCKGATYTVTGLETKPARKSPAPPFTTSTLQQEASRKLSFSVAQTMSVAQKLYEAGLITYMRTDSVNLSEMALAASRNEIVSAYGANFAKTRQYTTKSASAQEAHEAIRPTYFDRHRIEGERNAERLYELIWKRAIASQMEDAQLEKTTATIEISGVNTPLIATGEVLKFEGFLKVYREGIDDEEDEQHEMLPAIATGEVLPLDELTATERFSRPPARYTEASLVKKMEENGIGRPSTYAPTIATIVNRGYVVKEDREGRQRKYRVIRLKDNLISQHEETENTGAEKAKLFPTDIGTVVTDFLMKHFSQVMDYQFTASVEKEFDDIAAGQIAWEKMIGKFYRPFHQTVEQVGETAEREKGERELGLDPATGKLIIARIGRFGPLVEMKGRSEDEKPVFANLKAGQLIESITFEEALELFKMPRQLGLFEGKEVKVNIGRFGPYVQHDGKFASIPKDMDPAGITLEQAGELILAKRKQESERLIKTFSGREDVQLLNGRWGPYLAIGKSNFKLPKGAKVEALTLEDCLKLAEEQGGMKKTSAKTASKASGKTAAATKKPAAKKKSAKKTTKSKSPSKGKK